MEDKYNGRKDAKTTRVPHVHTSDGYPKPDFIGSDGEPRYNNNNPED